MRWAILVAVGLLFGMPAPTSAEDVTDTSVVVQTTSCPKNPGDGYTVKARVKIKKEGTYIVVGGFVKEGCWHKGSISGTNYFGTKKIKGDAGDVFDIEIFVPSPPLNNTYDVKVYTSEADIKTKG